MTPEAVSAEVDAVSLLGRGGAGFPAGRKWSMLRKAPTTYLVVNGDESEPATFKDHLLLERDPHQLIEGVVIAAYAIGSGAGLHLRSRRIRPRSRAVQQAVNEAYDHGAVGPDIFGSGFSVDVVVHPGAGAYICGEETALLESLEGKRGFPRIKPPYFPAAIGLYGEPHRGQQRGDPVQPAVGHGATVRARSPLSGRAVPPAPGCSPSPGTWSNPGVVRGGDGEDHVPRPHLRPRRSAAGSPAVGSSKPSSPAACRRRGSGPTSSTSRWARTRWARPGSMLGSGSIVVMDDSTCMVRAAWRITRFFCRESCGQCTPCREGSGWLEKVLRRIEDGEGARSRPRPADGRLRQPGPGVSLAARSRRRSACSARPSLRRSPRPSGCSETSSWSTSRTGGVPLADPPLDPTRDLAPRHRPQGRAEGTVTITLDGREVTAKAGQFLIAAAERAGIFIPRFCYHPRMKPVGMCRMCLVEVSGPRGAPPLQPACYVPVAEGMEVVTDLGEGQKGPGRGARVPAREPPARLPGVRQGRRVPAAGPGPRLRAGREPVPGGEAALGQAHPHLRARAARPRALHPVRALRRASPPRSRARRRSTSWAGATPSR